MQPKWIFLLLLLFCCAAMQAQQKSANKFLLVIPEAWKAKPRLLMKLSEMIRHQVPALQQKEECFNCAADYRVQFYVFLPRIHHVLHPAYASQVFTIRYSFYAFMDVVHKNGALLHRMVLNDTTMEHMLQKVVFTRGPLLKDEDLWNTLSEIVRKYNSGPAAAGAREE